MRYPDYKLNMKSQPKLYWLIYYLYMILNTDLIKTAKNEEINEQIKKGKKWGRMTCKKADEVIKKKKSSYAFGCSLGCCEVPLKCFPFLPTPASKQEVSLAGSTVCALNGTPLAKQYTWGHSDPAGTPRHLPFQACLKRIKSTNTLEAEEQEKIPLGINFTCQRDFTKE